MPISVTETSGGTAYGDIRAGAYHNIHQVKLDVSELAAAVDANGFLPPGLPMQADGSPVDDDSQTAPFVIGPEAVKLGSADHFGNALTDGPLNKDMIEDNLGRVLTADELAALALGGFKLID